MDKTRQGYYQLDQRRLRNFSQKIQNKYHIANLKENTMSATKIIAKKYNGISLAPKYLTYVMEDLNASFQYIEKEIHGKKTVMTCLLTIHSEGYDLLDTIEGEQSRIDKMIREFGKLTYEQMKNTYPRNLAKNKPTMAGFWKTIYIPKRQNTFKILLILDTDLYYISELEKDPQDAIKERLIESWATVNSLSISNASDQIHFSSDFAKQIECNLSGMEVIFPTIGQLCTYDMVGEVLFASFQVMPYKYDDFR